MYIYIYILWYCNFVFYYIILYYVILYSVFVFYVYIYTYIYIYIHLYTYLEMGCFVEIRNLNALYFVHVMQKSCSLWERHVSRFGHEGPKSIAFIFNTCKKHTTHTATKKRPYRCAWVLRVSASLHNTQGTTPDASWSQCWRCAFDSRKQATTMLDALWAQRWRYTMLLKNKDKINSKAVNSTRVIQINSKISKYIKNYA